MLFSYSGFGRIKIVRSIFLITIDIELYVSRFGSNIFPNNVTEGLRFILSSIASYQYIIILPSFWVGNKADVLFRIEIVELFNTELGLFGRFWINF